MKEIKAIVRNNRLDEILDALYAHPTLPGVVVCPVNVFGRTSGRTDNEDISHALVQRVMIQCVVDEASLEELIDVLTEHGRTGIPGDGVITISDVNEMVRIRTGERGTHLV